MSSYEYEVYLLDARYHLAHKGDVILATNNLAVACSYCSDYYKTYKTPVCVWQPRLQSYREHYAEWFSEDDEMKRIPKGTKLTKDGGRYYRAKTFRLIAVYSMLPLVTLILVLAYCNPFWFRDQMFYKVERLVNKYTDWVYYKQYAIYLGCDPEIWHTLKGDLE